MKKGRVGGPGRTGTANGAGGELGGVTEEVGAAAVPGELPKVMGAQQDKTSVVIIMKNV